MAGHSKWANTKHRKNAQDIKRSKIFTKIIKEISTSSMKYGSDVSKNFQLRNLLEKANTYNLKKKSINKAIHGNVLGSKKDIFNSMKYAGYSSFGIAVIVYCNTDNSNRTVSSIRNIFSKFNTHLINFNNIKYLFDYFYTIKIDFMLHEKKNLLNIVNTNNLIISKKINKNFLEIKILTKHLTKIKKYFLSYSIIFKNVITKIIPKNILKINEEDHKKLMNMIHLLEKLKETTYIIHNGNR
ncbi:YebC/PmpR family DNA-binding transcriptional regulator [Buchnera aphidicola]|uniref:Probable transcriptional regulatory protein YebC n=1 Tax=Buchnera aphidicola (Cinara cf. splendens/pseudotsugae 3390) TaxID=2518980 RepID=A0A451CX29_9GAMM|nr:YebC/PmpR family DNA-binding transcriptional regulator [Buchnera aphidicola]VFP77787.1 Probable transcriptional regulatory protein YebC [Buchnera aphidicola (Cinara cf. splendens/pseudotsugae 3390)]